MPSPEILSFARPSRACPRIEVKRPPTNRFVESHASARTHGRPFVFIGLGSQFLSTLPKPTVDTLAMLVSLTFLTDVKNPPTKRLVSLTARHSILGGNTPPVEMSACQLGSAEPYPVVLNLANPHLFCP